MTSSALVTTPLVLTCTALLMVMDFILVLIARRIILRDQFLQLRGELVVFSGVFFLLVWIFAMLLAWDWFYSYIFPPWARYLLPPIFGISYTFLAIGMARLSVKLPGSPASSWCLLGGLEGLLSHLFAIYVLGAASKPPIMQGADQLSVLIFAIFEKCFYWSLILLAVRLPRRGGKRVRGKSDPAELEVNS